MFCDMGAIVISPQVRATERILVIAPHADDEVIGCGGVIALAAEAGAEVTRVIMATGGITHSHLAKGATTDERMAEIEASGKALGISRTRVLFPGHDMRLEGLSMLQMVTALDSIIRSVEFDECYLPEPSHNRDHQITHDAAVAALRPNGRRLHSWVVAYEGTALDLRASASSVGMLYVNVAATLNKKIAALHAYRSQIRQYPHPTSEEAIRRLAAMRGLECGLDHAERFRVLRVVRP